MNAVLSLQGLTIGYSRPTKIVAQHLTLQLKAGEMVCLLGPNGAGKSTLLRTIAAMQAPLAGQVLLNGDNIHRLSPRERAQQLSIVLTQRIDGGLLTGYELVALGRHPYTDMTGRLSTHDKAVIEWAVEAVEATALAPRLISTLSDGERQKMMIARALAQEPAVMLLDEPTAFLDLPRRVELMRLLRHLAEHTGRVILISTHDLELALRSAHRLWLMDGNGIIRDGTPEDLILNGAFQATFDSSGVAFDPETGMFKLHQQTRGDVSVHGEGLAHFWTRHALEREGFRVVSDAALQIEVHPQHWRLLKNENWLEYHTLYDLMAVLKSHLV